MRGVHAGLSLLVAEAGKSLSAGFAGNPVAELVILRVCAGVVVCSTVALAQPVVFVLLVNVRIEHTAATCERAGDSVRRVGSEATSVCEGKALLPLWRRNIERFLLCVRWLHRPQLSIIYHGGLLLSSKKLPRIDAFAFRDLRDLEHSLVPKLLEMLGIVALLVLRCLHRADSEGKVKRAILVANEPLQSVSA